MKHHFPLLFCLAGITLLVFTGCMTPEELRAYKIKTVNDFMATPTVVRVLPVSSPEMNFASYGSAYLMLSARQHLAYLKTALDNRDLYQSYINSIRSLQAAENLSEQDATAKVFQQMTANDATLPESLKIATLLTQTADAMKHVNPDLLHEEYHKLVEPIRYSFSRSNYYQDFDRILFEFAKSSPRDCHEIKEITDSIRYNNDFLPPHLKREKSMYLARLRKDPNEVTSTILPPNNTLPFVQQQVIEQSCRLYETACRFSREHSFPPLHDRHDRHDIYDSHLHHGPHDMGFPLPPRIREELVAFFFLDYHLEIFMKAADCMQKLHELKLEEEQLQAIPQQPQTLPQSQP